MRQLLTKLKTDYPTLNFTGSDHFAWSPKTSTITYAKRDDSAHQDVTLLHELAHAVLEHTAFASDFELLLKEVAAWEKAQELGEHYCVAIPEDHIQKCLDTYRDWLHSRSTCPSCTNNGLQSRASKRYSCPNCGMQWSVSSSRLCRPYRQVATGK